VALLALAAGCANGGAGNTSTGGPTASSDRVSIVSYSNSVESPSGGDHHLTAAASCKAGEQMLAGGYVADDVFESAFFLDASYPSASATWTVNANSISNYRLEALVYCLQAYPSLDIQILQANECPNATILLSQGVQGPTPYILCASAHYVSPLSGGSGFRIGSVAVRCGDASTGTTISETRSFSYTCATQ
jgi:hypothetical protein